MISDRLLCVFRVWCVRCMKEMILANWPWWMTPPALLPSFWERTTATSWEWTKRTSTEYSGYTNIYKAVLRHTSSRRMSWWIIEPYGGQIEKHVSWCMYFGLLVCVGCWSKYSASKRAWPGCSGTTEESPALQPWKHPSPLQVYDHIHQSAGNFVIHQQ